MRPGPPASLRLLAPAALTALTALTALVALVAAVSMLSAAGCHAPRAAPAAAPRAEAVFAHGAVAADHPVASAAGAEMLRRGGNAVDAAVATSFCLSVVRPYSAGIGGGGFMVIHVPAADGSGPARRIAIDYRETAPAAIDPDYYARLDDPVASRFGPRAVAVPGNVAGLLFALERHGTLSRREVLAPAIRAAEGGFAADAHFVETVHGLGRRLDEHPRWRATADYLWRRLGRSGRLEVGDVITNPEQARALRLIAEDGADAFYRGPIADAIVGVMEAGGGAVTHADLAAYRPQVTAPLVGRYGVFEVVTMPPPSSGGLALLQVLGILERLGMRPPSGADAASPWRRDDPLYVHLVAEAMKHAFADRAEWLADPAYAHVPTEALLDPAYLAGRAATISPDHTLDPSAYGSVAAGVEDGGTTHLSVVDGAGMAVACTETINLAFGSLVCVPGFGFALNDEMDDFTTRRGAANAFGLRQSDRNLPHPGQRPLSSMTPVIVLRDGRVVLVAGASGGPRIITGTLQCVLNCVLHGMDPGEAVAASRFHHQWMPDVLQFEEAWTDEATIEALRARGHVTGRRTEVGNVQVIRAGKGGLHAASDPRRGGRPAGH